MKTKNRRTKERKDAVDLFIDEFRIPKPEIPLEINGIKIGTLQISLEPGANEKEKRGTQARYLLEFANLSADLFIQLKKTIESQIRICETYFEEINKFDSLTRFLLVFQNYGVELHSILSNFLFYNEKKMLEILRTTGPIILNNLGVQKRLQEWALGRETVNNKLEEIKNALCEYGQKTRLEDTPLKIGASKKIGTRDLNEKNIRLAYFHLKIMFKFIKEKYKDLNLRKTVLKKGILELITAGGVHALWHTIELFVYNDPSAKTWRDWLDSIHTISGLKEDPKPKDPIDAFSWMFKPINDLIDNDQVLKEEFICWQWTPSIFARQVLGRLVGVSSATLESFLFRKRKPIPKSIASS